MTDRKMTLCYSRDGGRNWSNVKERALGELGEYRKDVHFHRLGQHRQFVAKIRVSSPIKAPILGMTARVS